VILRTLAYIQYVCGNGRSSALQVALLFFIDSEQQCFHGCRINGKIGRATWL